MAMDKERETLVARLGELAGELSALASIQPVTGHLVERTLRSSAFCMRQAIAALTAQQEPVGGVHIVFDGPPSNESGRFVEVETPDGRSISWGRWEQRGKYWHLIAPQPADGVVVPREGMLQAAKWLENEAAKSVNRREYLLAATALLAAAKEPR